VVVSTDGVVLTNHHVVDRAEDILVTLHDGREFDAKLEGSDPKSDVAVLKLEGEVSELVPIEFGDSEDLRLGEMVLAIGNPFGLSSTVTMGIVSAKSRANMGIMDYEDFIQTDAAINPGNSGGALVNLDGDLVGINTAIISRTGGYQGVGLAIPSTMARAVMKSIEEHGKVMRGWLGVVIQDVDPELADAMGLEVSVGVVVADVVEGSPADEAGIERGDVIIEMNGAATDTAAHLRNEVAMLGPGRTAEFLIVRGDEKRTVEVTLGELSEQGGPEPAEGPEQVQVLDGLGVAALDAATRSKLGIPEDVDSGVVVTEVAPGSAAHEAGLAAGDVIVQVDKKDVKSPAGFAELVEKAGDKVLLLVFRDGNTIFVVLEK
jgi:serine protease Do